MDIQSVITEEEFNKVGRITYPLLIELITRVVKLSVEESLRALPSVVTHLAKQSVYLKTLSEEFYKSNPELAKHKELVGKIIESVEANNPDKSFDSLMPIVAQEAKRQLGNIAKVTTYKGSNLGVL